MKTITLPHMQITLRPGVDLLPEKVVNDLVHYLTTSLDEYVKGVWFHRCNCDSVDQDVSWIEDDPDEFHISNYPGVCPYELYNPADDTIHLIRDHHSPAFIEVVQNWIVDYPEVAQKLTTTENREAFIESLFNQAYDGYQTPCPPREPGDDTEVTPEDY